MGPNASLLGQAEGQQSAIKYISLITALVTIGLNATLIPLFGLGGAAAACLLSFLAESMLATSIVPGTRAYLKLYFGSFRTLYEAVRNWIRNRKAKGGASE